MAETKGFKDRLTGTTYDLKDATAREGVATNAEAIEALAETVEALAETVPVVDDNLETAGAAADAKAAGDRVSDIKNALRESGNDLLGNKIYAVSHHGAAFNGQGNVIDITSPTPVNNWNSYVIPCAAQDIFTVYAVGGTTTYAWAFIDSNGNILSRSSSEATVNGKKITADANAEYLVVCDKGGNSRVYGGELNKADVVPSYFESNLSAKIPEIIDNMNEAGQAGTTFVFITDLHWETNYRNSPSLVKRVLDKTSVKNVFCGGDIINQGDKLEMSETFLDCIDKFRFVPNNGFFPIARGNHDDNSNWSSSAEVTQYEFNNNTIYNLLYSQVAESTTRIGSNWAFYFDQPAIKTRYIFVDTKRNGLTIDTAKIMECMSAVETGWHIIIVMHFTLNNATTLFAGCDLLAHIVKAYNNRESGSYTGSYQTATYDFTSAVGTVDLIIGGHMHADYAMDADDTNNPAGVPIVATDTDSYRNHSGTEGTVNSQCFDVVTVNYTAKTVKCVRIGRGNDRDFSY